MSVLRPRPVPQWEYEPKPPFIAADHAANLAATADTIEEALAFLAHHRTDEPPFYTIVDARGEFLYVHGPNPATSKAVYDTHLRMVGEDAEDAQVVMRYHEAVRLRMTIATEPEETPT